MPSWIQGFATHQPVTPVIETIRPLLLGTPAGIVAVGGAGLVRRDPDRVGGCGLGVVPAPDGVTKELGPTPAPIVEPLHEVA